MIQNCVFSVSFHRKSQLKSPFGIIHCTSQDDTVHASCRQEGKEEARKGT